MAESLTLAFQLTALEALRNPRTAFEDARTWSMHIGAISETSTHQLVNELRDMGIYEEDFVSGTATPSNLSRLAARFETDRYVCVVGNQADIDGFHHPPWSSIQIAEAAEKAGWNLASNGHSPSDVESQ